MDEIDRAIDELLNESAIEFDAQTPGYEKALGMASNAQTKNRLYSIEQILLSIEKNQRSTKISQDIRDIRDRLSSLVSAL